MVTVSKRGKEETNLAREEECRAIWPFPQGSSLGPKNRVDATAVPLELVLDSSRAKPNQATEQPSSPFQFKKSRAKRVTAVAGQGPSGNSK